MELSDLLTKEKEIKERKDKLNKEIYNINRELDSLYESAWNEGFVFDNEKKTWYKES